jgi:hypothetical protein
MPIKTKTTTEAMQLKKIKLKAAIIRGNGEIVPVVKTQFKFLPYNLKEIRKKLVEINKPDPEPNIKDPIYARDDFPDIFDTKKYFPALEEWQKKAYAGIDNEIKKASNGRSEFSVTTDLSGEVIFEVPLGKFYVSGEYSILNKKSNIYWTHVEFDITANTEKIELSNDNGTVLNW